MNYKILESMGVENENIDGAAFNNFCASGKDLIIPLVLNECIMYSPSSNIVCVGTGELLVHGFRVKIIDTYEVSLGPSASLLNYQIVARINLNEDLSVSFEMECRPSNSLIQQNLFYLNRGTYEVEIGTFTNDTNGISNVKRTLPVTY